MIEVIGYMYYNNTIITKLWEGIMKNLKRIIAIAIILVSIVSLGTIGACADNLNWKINKGDLIISGYGEMPDYSGKEAPWREKDKKAKNVKNIYVEDGVTYIGDQCFQFCESAKYAQIADSVEAIGEAAFYSCKKLEEVIMSVELAELGVSAFDHCEKLEYIVIPEGVEVIENAAFNCCTSLEWVFIPGSVTEIGDSAFNACKSLKTVYYGGSWSDWDEIEIGGYNKYLTGAELLFNYEVSYE